MGSSRLLIAGFFGAFVLTLASFVTTAVMVRNKARHIGTAADSIVRNGAPSLQRLSAMRSTLRRLEVSLDDATDHLASSGPAGQATGAVASTVTVLPASAALDRLALETDWNAYRALPIYPREELQRSRVGDALDRTQAAIHALGLQFAQQDGAEASRVLDQRLKPTFEQLDQALDQAIRVNAATSNELAANIKLSRENVNWLAMVLDGASVGLSLVAAAFAIRLARGYVRSQQARMEELDLFASRVAHDIRSPLAAAALGMDVALRAQPEGSKGESLLRRARLSLHRVDQLVEGLLSFARSARVAPGDGACHVGRVLTQVLDELRPVAQQQNVALVVAPPTACEVECSEAMLANVLANLVQNAIKYMGDATVRQVDVRAKLLPTRVRIEVQDTGPGIPAALLPTLFLPYTRAGSTAVPGLGLGLATVQRVTEALGGQVGVFSEEGSGSLFWVELPLLRVAVVAPVTAAISSGP